MNFQQKQAEASKEEAIATVLRKKAAEERRLERQRQAQERVAEREAKQRAEFEV